MNASRFQRTTLRVFFAAATAVVGTTFDSCSAAWKIFRSESSQQIGAGLKTALDGVIDGVIAVVDPSDTQSQDAATDTGT